jgi:prefoldin subunit 5
MNDVVGLIEKRALLQKEKKELLREIEMVDNALDKLEQKIEYLVQKGKSDDERS